jgi:hypothetical protein
MPTAWDPAVRNGLLARARALTPQHTAKWGKFTAAGMLAHLNESTRMATGELPVTAKAPSFLRWPPLRYLIVHHLPMPKSACSVASSAVPQRAGAASRFRRALAPRLGMPHPQARGSSPAPVRGVAAHL